MYKDVKKRLRKALSFCDRLIVATEPLKAAYEKMIDDIVVVPNYIEQARWGGLVSKRRQGTKPRVGWAGSVSHVGDLELIVPVVEATATEFEWVFFGLCPQKIVPMVAELHPAVVFDQYPEKLASLNLDLALAPLERNNFNEGKSNLRLLEYGMLGWPVIATDLYPYQNAPVTRVPNNTRAWINALREHLGDLDSAAKAGDELRQWVLDNWILEDHLQDWLTALTPENCAAESNVGLLYTGTD